MRKLKVFNLLLVLSAFWSSFSLAYDSATCSNLTSKNSFSATFNFTTILDSNNEPINSQTIFAERSSNDHQSIALWSNGSISALIKDTITKQPGTYTVWLTYDKSNNNKGQNKQGQLSFYLLSSGAWVKKVGPVTADLSSFSDIHIDVTGANVSDLQCDASLNKPEVVTEPPFKFDVCKYFPQPIQSWVTENTKNYSGYPESELRIGESSAYVTGWSNNYVSDPRNIYTYKQDWDGKSWPNLRLGFDKINNSWLAYQNPTASVCQGMGCFPDPVLDLGDGNVISRKAVPPPLLDITFDDNSDSLKFGSGNFKQLCDGVICSYDDSGSEIYVTIHRDLKFLNGDNNSDKPIIFKIPENIKIELLTLGNNFGAYFFESGNVYIGKIITKGEGNNTSLSFRSGVTLNVVGTGQFVSNKDYDNFDFQISNAIDFLYKDAKDNDIDFDTDKDFVIPVFYAPSARVHLKSKGILRAYILARLVDFDLPITIQGSITANDLAINTSVNVIRDSSYDCWSGEEPNDEYKLELQPSSAYVLSCQTQQLEFQVQDSDGNSTGDFSGTIEVSPSNYLTLADVDGNGTGNNGSYSPNASGKLWLELSGSEDKNETNTVSITANLNPKNNSSSKTGTYHFVPYKFSVADHYVIANNPIEVIATVQGCNTDGSVVDIGYDGKPDVSPQWVRPASGAIGDLTYVPIFAGGKSSDDLTLEDSGELLVTLTDDNFSCRGDDCPIEGDGDTKTLKGQFTVYSRPWTFAICSTDNTKLDDATGDSNSGNGFIAAGETFDAKVLPLRYTDSGSISGEVKSTSSLCGQDVTSNFFLGDSSDNTVVISSSVETPTQSDDLVFSSEISRKNSNSEYTFTGLSWEDVGSLKLMATTGDNSNCASGGTLQTWYECTQMGYRKVGRFYPAYFKITQSDWSVENQNDIAYLSQPYDLAEFAIVPYSLNGNAVENYSQFDLSLQANISVLDDEDLGARLAVSVNDGDWDNDSTHSRWYLEDKYAVFYRDFTLNTQGIRESSVDGPFNVLEDTNSTTTNFGFTILKNSDPVDSRTQNDTACLNSAESYSSACDLSFPKQPSARYGRMAMDDVGGTSVSTINIPLRTEYWNGSRFITNTDDSASDYSSDEDYVCYQEVWSEASGSDGSLNGVTKTVDSGVSDELYANPYSEDDSSSIRQQLRFWLRMDDTSTTSPQTLETDDVTCGSRYMSQPWLQYNWRGKGDEDPSSVVTFGIHRGNDRVIYRGEPGLTAQ